MSELKATTVYDAYWKANSVGEGTGTHVYLKSEADKVIAEKDSEIARLNAIRKVHVEAIESMGAGLLQDDKEIRHQKYKRCLAMALLWLERAENSTDLENELVSRRRCSKWMEIAEKFKEAKAPKEDK